MQRVGPPADGHALALKLIILASDLNRLQYFVWPNITDDGLIPETIMVHIANSIRFQMIYPS